MAGNRKPRKKYVPKYANRTPINFKVSAGDDLDLKLIPHSELEKLRTGEADAYTINTLAFRINFGYVMAGEVYDGHDARVVTLAGLDALRCVKARFDRTGKYGASGEEFKRLGDALNITDDMQDGSTRREQLASMKAVFAINEHLKKQP